MRAVLISLALAAAALSTSGALAAAPQPPARVSPYSPEGLAIQAQIKKLDRSIRFQQRMSGERAARMNGADTDRYVVYSPYYGYGGYGGYSAYGGYGGGYRVGYFPSSGSLSYSPGLGVYTYRPGFSAASPGPNRGTVKYRRLVQERAALQARLAPL